MMDLHGICLYTGQLSLENDFITVEAEKTTLAADVIKMAVKKLKLGNPENFEVAEVFCSGGQLCKERCVDATENPVRIQLLWPKVLNEDSYSSQGTTGYRFYIRKKDVDFSSRSLSWLDNRHASPVDTFLTTFLKQPTSNKEYPDLCSLPDLNEKTLLDNIRARFYNGNIYTYVGSILIAVNPFKFFPIYNPKYVKMYQYKWLGDLPPHIFAIADAAFSTMLRTRKNQCIVISGESGSGKTESTNLLLHHLTALSQKGNHATGVEQTILGAGPVLEAFGNAKTVHNNNSSRFGKFIQVNYKEYGMVHGAIVEKYLLEKSRIVSQAKNERNYHVFYYLLKGASAEERSFLHLHDATEYHYLSQSNCYTVDGVDEEHEFARLKQSMEMVGFSTERQHRIFSVLSAVLHLGNVEFKKKGDLHHDESVVIRNEAVITVISNLLKVKETTLIDALTQKRTVAGGETVFMNYKMEDAIATRDALAKCLYGVLFDWIVLKVNHALLAKRHNSEHQVDFSPAPSCTRYDQNPPYTQGNSIGVLDIFGFEDFHKNSFEQFCINYANEHLQYYFNQHIFKLEQEEYQREGIQWKNIEFIDNTGCLELFSKKPNGLFCLLDEECNFPGASNDTLLSKFNRHHKGKPYYEVPQLREGAFVVVHYAGKVKYSTVDFREKNSDLIRTDIVGVLKNSSSVFVKELLGVDPVAILRWGLLRAFFRCVAAFISAGKEYQRDGKSRKPPKKTNETSHRESCKLSSDNLLRSDLQRTCCSNLGNKLFNSLERKNKCTKSKYRQSVSYRDVRTLKTIATRTMIGGGRFPFKKQPPSVSAQFQWSLSRLMETLSQGNPFFVRCIKSNSEKAPCQFDDDLVLRQLHYTGMLATVKIRQSGYNYRLTFDEFIHQYKIILPNGLLSSKEDVKKFLECMDLNQENYQIGITKVFLREVEKVRLDEALHRAIMQRVITIQRWMKALLERQNFIKQRAAALNIQCHVRRFLAQRKLAHKKLERDAAITIQSAVRMMIARKKFLIVQQSVTLVQPFIRGCLARKRVTKLLEEARQKKITEQQDWQSSISDEGILTKGFSAEELELDTEHRHVQRHDSEESSGILEDSETEAVSSSTRGNTDPVISPVHTPASPEEEKINNVPFIAKKPFNAGPLEKRPLSRVQEMAQAFQRKSESSLHDCDTSSPSGSYSLPYDAPLLLTILLPLQHHGLKHSRELSSSALFPLISPEKQGNNERASMFVYEKQSTEGGGEKSVINISPFRRARKHFKNIMGGNRKGGRKDIPYDDSDDSIPDDLQVKMQRPLEIGAPTNLEYLPTFGHDEILQTSSYGIQVPCGPVLMDGRRASSNRKKPHRRGMRSKSDMKMPPTNWSVAGTSQWQYPEELMVSDIRELQLLDEFIYKKLMNLSLYNSQRDTICDVVFKKSLKEFHRDLTACLSIAMLKDVVTTQYRYRDLMNNFEQVLQAQVKNVGTNAAFPVTMGVNAFRGFLDEFMKESKEIRRKEKKEERKTESKSTKKERQKKDMLEYLGHKFLTVQFNIPTFCELCSSIIWIMEKGFVCQVCKYTCHKKCCFRSTTSCKGIPTPRANDGSVGNNQVFGFPLESLITDGENVPLVAEKLISAIELHGLYTVGLYRKCGAAAKVKQLKNAVDEEGIENVDLDEYPIHVLTTTLKCFFRELPEPLLTYDLYDDFIQASEIKESVEAIQALYAVTERLPKSNYHLFERLIFHLARVAQHEDSNKMSANGLAIIFVPCLLRTNKKMQAQESLQQVPKQSQCIESIISEQLRKLKATLADISTLNTAQATANDRLIYVRASIKSPKPGESPEEEFVEAVESPSPDNLGLFDARAEELALSAHIECIQKEKEDLTCNLPRLECQQLSSDDESNSVEGLLSNAPDCTDADETNEEYAVTFDLPVNPPSRLKHLNKRRVAVPHRHLPSKYRTRKPSDTRSHHHHHRPQPNFPIQIIANSGGYRRMRNAGLVLSLERLDDVQEDEIMV
ncbi:unconventional myosin-IXAa isoform X18 [Octopus vulgaris]|uniref:Unconventional myosin-IXAa isoform X18 n=1 Tax=Octopus vulgaris TaxID=6645 RepID=A0AA36BCW5_OCTVU|nr:unconventional myosin-IXAa isoform X18 [Octopus vulgaris]